MSTQQQENRLIRVVLADDHAGVRVSIRYLLEREPNIAVVAETADGIEALQLAQRLLPDILLLDIEMPGMNGIEVARRLKLGNSSVRVLALSSYDQHNYIVKMLQHGAAGYLVKDEAPELLIEAVQGIHAGETGWFSARVHHNLGNGSNLH